MKRLVIEFLRDTRGATSSEYAIMAAGVACAIFAAATLFGFSVRDLFQTAVNIFPGGS
jgi:Flp pilus assembly pilin Flp